MRIVDSKIPFFINKVRYFSITHLFPNFFVSPYSCPSKILFGPYPMHFRVILNQYTLNEWTYRLKNNLKIISPTTVKVDHVFVWPFCTTGLSNLLPHNLRNKQPGQFKQPFPLTICWQPQMCNLPINHQVRLFVGRLVGSTEPAPET